MFVSIAPGISDLTVSVSHDAALVASLINNWHSWRTSPAGWRVAFLLLDDCAIYGVSTFGRPVARLEDQHRTLEHTRMALGPGAPRNSASWFMARCRAWIRENMPDINRLISYVPAGEYRGVTYLADNWAVVYEEVPGRATWTNRAGRLSSENVLRTKFERVP